MVQRRRMRFGNMAAAALLIALGTAAGSAQAPQAPAPAAAPPAAVNGQAVFDRACASCHVEGSSAPAPAALRQFTPEAILNALVNGKMAVQGSSLSEAERRAVAEFVTAKTF